MKRHDVPIRCLETISITEYLKKKSSLIEPIGMTCKCIASCTGCALSSLIPDEALQMPNYQLPQPGGAVLFAGPLQFILLSLGSIILAAVSAISSDSRTGGNQGAF